jgi:hypothetical protein
MADCASTTEPLNLERLATLEARLDRTSYLIRAGEGLGVNSSPECAAFLDDVMFYLLDQQHLIANEIERVAGCDPASQRLISKAILALNFHSEDNLVSAMSGYDDHVDGRLALKLINSIRDPQIVT